MIRDKTAERLAMLLGDARLYYGMYTCASTPEVVFHIKQDAVAAIRKCYEFISREEMQKRFPEIDNTLDRMFHEVKFK